MFLFNAAVADEPIQGVPKFIRTVTSDLVIESEFGLQGDLVERRTYRPDGSLSHRETRTDRDNAGRQTFQLDNDGRASFPLLQMTVELRQDGDRTALVTYGNDGVVLSRAETNRNGDVATCLITLPVQRLKTERIDQRDSVGNWTRKTLFESSNPEEIGEVVSIVERTILYFDAAL